MPQPVMLPNGMMGMPFPMHAVTDDGSGQQMFLPPGAQPMMMPFPDPNAAPISPEIFKQLEDLQAENLKLKAENAALKEAEKQHLDQALEN